MKYYKFINEKNRGYNGLDYTEYLPHDGQPGKPLPTIEGVIKLCSNGYHACGRESVALWIDAQLYEVELYGTVVDGGDKTAASNMRFVRKVAAWNDRTQRLFAVRCAREALKPVDNPDPRSVTACDTAERYANGAATVEELVAAWSAAMDAAVAAGAVAWLAVKAADRSAVWSAVWAAARAAAWSVAWSAARAAALAADRSAARAASVTAALAATLAVDGDAARAAQSEQLLELCGEEYV